MVKLSTMIDRELHARQITGLLKRFPVVAILGAPTGREDDTGSFDSAHPEQSHQSL